MNDYYPEPSPSPGPSPMAPPEDPEEAVNLFKVSLKKVLDSLQDGEDSVGAHASLSKTEELTEGLGGTGSVWQSPLADTMAETVAGIISSITSDFTSATNNVEDEWSAEPTYVDKDDSRATWGLS